MPLNQSEIYTLLEQADGLPGLIDIRVGRWRVWPVVKLALYSALTAEMIGGDQGGHQRQPRFTEKAGRALAAGARGLQQLRDVSGSASIALLTVPRLHRYPDGCERDAIYDELPSRTGSRLTPLILDYSWSLYDSRAERRPGRYSLDLAIVSASLLRSALLRHRAIQQAVAAMAAIVKRGEIAAYVPNFVAVIAQAIASFEAKRRVFRGLFRRIGARLVVLTDSPFKSGEIAAARELALPVIELQHGMFGPRCPEYGWPASFAGCKDDMPLPNRLFVFGDLWRTLALQGGFWTEQETPIVGAGAIDRYRAAACAASGGAARASDKTRLVFMTQATNRAFIIDFWRRFFEIWGDRPIDVLIKVHPGEVNATAQYATLAQSAPDRCRIAAPTANPFDLMIESDLVMSCNSYSLAEAIGLGRPAISLCGGQIPGGFAGTFVLPQLRPVMPHIGSPTELVDLLEMAANDTSYLDDWRERTTMRGEELYARGFLDRASALIAEMSADRAA